MPTDHVVIDAYTHSAAPELLAYLDREGGKKGPYNAFYNANDLFHDVGARLSSAARRGYGLMMSGRAPLPPANCRSFASPLHQHPAPQLGHHDVDAT